jgi:hypothetical protein
MSQFEQMAIPMRDLFTDQPDLTPYTAVPVSFPFQLTRRNAGAALSARQYWSRPDGVLDEILNELLLDYLHGSGRLQ